MRGSHWIVWVVPLLLLAQTLGILGLVGCAILRRRGARPRRAFAAFVLLLAVSDASILAIVLTHDRTFNRGAVPERP